MQITAIEKNNRKKKNMKKAAISATVIFAMMTCLSFAYATSIFEAVGDALFAATSITNPLDVIVSSFLLLVFKTIIQCVVNVLDIVISPINEITTMKMAELAQYLPFAEYQVQFDEGEFAFDYTIASKVNDYIIGIGVLIWILLSCFAILMDFYYVASGDKRAVPGSKLFVAITVTGVLTYKAQDLMFFLFDNEINPIVKEFLDIAQKSKSGINIFENIGSSLCASWQGVPGILIALVMVLMIGINYIKLALEMVQRYLIVAVICVLSPLAFATGSNQETIDISKKWFRMFWSQCVLLFLNVWCVYVVREGMMAIGDKKANQLLIWGLIVYGFIKVAQQLDDLLQNAGLSITRQTSGMLEDFLMMGKSMIGLASTAATAAASGFQFKQDSANLREGLANGTKTMDDYKRHMANTAANAARNPLALAMMAPQMAREYAAAKGAEAEYKQSVGDYLKMKSPDRSKATAPNLNSAAGRNQIKDALANSKDKKIADAAKNGEVTKAYTDSNGVIHASLQTRDKNGRANGMYDVAISGNGKDVMSQVASGREVTTDANGNKLIKDDKLGTFAYNKETGAFEQIKDKDGNVPQNPLSVQVPDKINKNNVEEVADWATKTDGFDKAVQEKEATDNYFNATDAERLNMDSSDVNQGQMNNMARQEINDQFMQEGANGEQRPAVGEDDKLDVSVNKETGEMTAKHAMTNDDGTIAIQNYKKDENGNWQTVGQSEYYTAMGDKPSYRNSEGEVFAGTQVGTSADGNAIMRYNQIGVDGNILENGKSFEVTQSGSLANSDDAASKVEMARQASESLGAKAVAADYDNAARLYNGNGANVPENTNFNSSENLYASQQAMMGAKGTSQDLSLLSDYTAVQADDNGIRDGVHTQTFQNDDGTRVKVQRDMSSGAVNTTMSAARVQDDGAVKVERLTEDSSGNVSNSHYTCTPNINPLDADAKTTPVTVNDSVSGQCYRVDVPTEIAKDGTALANYMAGDEGIHAIDTAKQDAATLKNAVVNSDAQPIPEDTRINPAAASSVFYEAASSGNCNLESLSKAAQNGDIEVYPAESVVDGKPCAQIIYRDPNTGLKTEVGGCLEYKDGKVSVTTTSAPMATQSQAQVEKDMQEMTTAMMTPANTGDGNADRDTLIHQQEAYDKFTGANNANYSGPIGAAAMAKTAGVNTEGYVPTASFITGQDATLVLEKSVPIPEDKKQDVMQCKEYTFMKASGSPEMKEAEKVTVSNGVGGVMRFDMQNGDTFEVFGINTETGTCSARKRSKDSDGFGETVALNLGKGKATEENILRSFMAAKAKTQESDIDTFFGKENFDNLPSKKRNAQKSKGKGRKKPDNK